MSNEHLVNENINELRGMLDLIVDEYGNYYKVVGTTEKGGKLEHIKLSHYYFEFAFSRLLTEDSEDLQKYKYKHIGCFIQDGLINHLKNLESKKRKIFTVKELLENGVVVQFMDLTERHPRSLPIK